MSLKEIVLKNRSYRRFYQDRKVSVKELEELVDIARNVASGANRQPLRYKVVCDASDNELMRCFPPPSRRGLRLRTGGYAPHADSLRT